MYAEYAKDPRMKLNLGIRRRLAPLLDNGRDEIELMTAILFSLPGSPGPLLRRRDRDGRQRLPRRPRRRAHADAVDGRPQRRLLARRLRAALRAAADGPGLRLPGGQRRGAAAHADLAAALAAPLHRAAQGAPGVRARHLRAARAVEPADLRPHPHATRTTSCSACTTSRARPRRSSSTCPRFEGRCPVEMFGRSRFPRIGELPYLLTLAPRGFYWFQLVEEDEEEVTDAVQASPAAISLARRRRSRAFVARPALVRRPRRARSTARRADRRARAAARRAAAARARRWSRRASRSGTHELYQLPLGVGRAADGAGRATRSLRRRRAGRSTTRSPTPRSARELLRPIAPSADARGRRGRRSASAASDGARRARRRRRGAAARRRAVELVDRVRRRADPEGLPPRRGRA